MKNKHLKSALQQRAEQLAPGSEIDLWPSIQARLSARHTVLPNSNGGPNPMKPSFRSFSVFAGICLALVLAAGFTLAMPQGRALAEQFLSLFFETAPDVRPLDPTPDSPAAITPIVDTPAAEDMAGWKVYKPAQLPDGFGFLSMDYRPERGLVVQEYTYQHPVDMSAAYFYLGQQKTPFADDWPVGESAKVETVQIGDVPGEYVIGAWGGDGNHLEWENNPAIQHLRWQANGFYFDLQFNIVGVEAARFAGSPYYLSREQLIAIAGSLK